MTRIAAKPYTGFIAALTVTLLTVGAAQDDDHDTGSEQATPVDFEITVDAGDPWEEDWVYIHWELVNESDAPVYVCQWPGPAFGSTWEEPDGIVKGHVPGYPHTRKLTRKYFVELKPGEALMGLTRYHVHPTPTGTLAIHGAYRSGQTGGEHGVSAWRGEADSNWVDVEVPKETASSQEHS